MNDTRWNTKALAEWVGRSEQTIYRWMRNGVIPSECYFKQGEVILFHPEKLRAHFGAGER